MNNQSPNTLRAAFIAVTTLFFAWGFITAMIDPLIPSVRAIFNLTYTQSMLTQFAFFMSYGIVSLPGAALVARAGYGRSILIALVAMIVGCLFMPFATYVQRYELVLVALFIIGSGITVLQLAANPLAAVLGPPERSHFRLTFSQAFNSLGTVIAPYLGSMLLLRGGVFDTNGAAADEASRAASLHNIDTGFLAIAAMIALLLIFIWRFSGRLSRAAPPAAPAHDSVLHALQSRWALLGAAAIFLYVGAEVSIGSVMINFLHQPDVLNVSFERAGKLLALYWLGAMVGRFAGSALLTRFRATFLLAIAAAIAALLCLTVSQGAGVVAGGCAIAVGLVNSIMFPTIFTITLERSTASAAATSGLLCMAIIGGALLPRVAGLIADASTLHTVFFLPAAAYVAITVFAMSAARARVVDVGQPAGNVAH
ncbi:MAG TPA: glucose/galactose MFS transporter [Steroidobacteraceae bacterium]|nr:glucose/galactose MFS transporter [Steroidobacteraceae bacterium]